MSQIQEQNKFPKTAPNETEIKYLPHRDVRLALAEKGRTRNVQVRMNHIKVS